MLQALEHVFVVAQKHSMTQQSELTGQVQSMVRAAQQRDVVRALEQDDERTEMSQVGGGAGGGLHCVAVDCGERYEHVAGTLLRGAMWRSCGQVAGRTYGRGQSTAVGSAQSGACI